MFIFFATRTCPAEKLSAEQLNELYVKSGLEKQIGSLPDLMASGIKQEFSRDKKLTEDQMKIIESSVRKNFHPNAMKPLILEHFQKKLSPEVVKELLAWLETPFGKKITSLEEKSSTPEFMKEMDDFIKNYDSNAAPPDNRIRITEKLCAATNVVDFSVNMICDIQISIANAAAIAGGNKENKKFEEFVKSVSDSKSFMKTMMKEQMNLSYIYIYRLLTVDELNAYHDFLVSPSGKVYTEATMEGLSTAMLACSETLGKELAEMGKAESKKKPDSEPVKEPGKKTE